MSNRYQRIDATLFVGKAMRDMREMKAELNEYRYCLEQNVERRTEHLLKRIALLESCNTTLGGKLAMAHVEIATLKHQPAYILPKEDMEPDNRTVKLYVMNNQTQKPVGLNAQGQGSEHAVAA